jgi:acetoacetyl-CoA synthetase
VLAARGHEVEFVGLVDVRAPLASMSGRDRKLRRFAERAAFLVPGFSENTLREFLRDHLRPAAQPDERRVLFRSAGVYDGHRWGRYDGPVTYFRAARRIPVLTNQLYAWRSVAPRLTVVDVPGAHHTVLDLANAPELARRLSRALDG